MAGILDNKSRIMDIVVTQHGKRQIAGTLGGGVLKAEFASFTDGETYYRSDVVSGSEDATTRIFFEAGSRKQDGITFETDDSGTLLGFEIDEELTLFNDQIFVKQPFAIESDFNTLTYATGSHFASVSENIPTSSIDHFEDLYMIGSLNSDESFNRQFKLSKNLVKFQITNTSPWKDSQLPVTFLDTLEPLFIDKRLSNVINFKFLPPMTSPPASDPFDIESEKSRAFLADFEPLGQYSEMTFSELMTDLNGDDSRGRDIDIVGDVAVENSSWRSTYSRVFLNQSNITRPSLADTGGGGEGSGAYPTILDDPPVPRETVYFTETSSENNLLMQMFEVNTDYSTFKKLDVIDFGDVSVSYDEDRPTKHVFFVGKIFFNELRIPSFVNLFTLIMD